MNLKQTLRQETKSPRTSPLLRGLNKHTASCQYEIYLTSDDEKNPKIKQHSSKTIK